VDLQEFMVMPAGRPNFSESLRCGIEIFHHLKKVLSAKGYNTAVGDEGGFAPDLKSNEEALQVIMEAIENSGYIAGDDVFIALDPASSEFYEDGVYNLKSENRKLSAGEMADLYADWVENYPIISIEDGLAEEDWEGWKILNEKIGGKVQLVGDDLFVTNTSRLERYGNTPGHRDGPPCGLDGGCVPPVRRDRGHHHIGRSGGHWLRADKDRFGMPYRQDRQIQSAFENRGGAGRSGQVSGQKSLFVHNSLK
jgi:hypothetical protein